MLITSTVFLHRINRQAKTNNHYQMKSIADIIIQLIGCLVLLFAGGMLFAHMSGYDEYYDKMLYDDDDSDLKIKKNKNNDDDIHRLNF